MVQRVPLALAWPTGATGPSGVLTFVSAVAFQSNQILGPTANVQFNTIIDIQGSIQVDSPTNDVFTVTEPGTYEIHCGAFFEAVTGVINPALQLKIAGGLVPVTQFLVDVPIFGETGTDWGFMAYIFTTSSAQTTISLSSGSDNGTGIIQLTGLLNASSAWITIEKIN